MPPYVSYYCIFCKRRYKPMSYSGAYESAAKDIVYTGVSKVYSSAFLK